MVVTREFGTVRMDVASPDDARLLADVLGLDKREEFGPRMHVWTGRINDTFHLIVSYGIGSWQVSDAALEALVYGDGAA